MAHIFRLILCVLACAICSLSWAALPMVTKEYRANPYFDKTPGWADTPAATCAQLVGAKNPPSGTGSRIDTVIGSVPGTGLWCTLTINVHQVGPPVTDLPDHASVSYSTRTVPGYCIQNSEPDGNGQCVCKSGFHQVEGACVADPTSSEKWAKWCSDATGQSLGAWTVAGKLTGTACLGGISLAGSPLETPGYQAGDVPDGGGCSLKISNGVSYQDPDGAWHTQGTASISGATCMEGGAPIPPDAPEGTEQEPSGSKDPCPNGYAGSVNGTSVCAQHDPNKGIDWTGKGTTTNADGSTTAVETHTACAGGRCTTTTTTTNTTAAGVSSSSSTSTEESIGALCARDKGNGACAATGVGGSGKENGGTSFSGNCAGGFKAESDDAVIAAMALEQHKRNCELYRTDGEPSQWLEAEGQKTGDRTTDNPNNSEVNVGPSNFDTSDALGGGGCSLNKTIEVRGFSATLPFNVLCDPLAVLGQLLVAVSLLLAARIVTRG